MASRSGKLTRWRQALTREWLRLLMASMCIAVLVSALVVMVSSAEPGWRTNLWDALKEEPWVFGSLLVLGIAGTLLPIAGAIVKIVAYEQRNKEQTTQGE